ncbi:class I SAM-dependent methyltransferase [Desulfofustis glycolicus]|uniref:2-polyprenyl-3-methyl-5-hydroxy-6-metoxy-1,4-benzoquinol methylase n=1 Tax=Desulfofustis glycolicus DSM 9705 TaxID=1121409 RepID=A0A1M5YV01_9BACT|nr:methyltransferase domain-containing protein [Desulfofustis glycolicus]SHI15907.1 2-polyprenyl-3-methyl-5-hydroxy-6-metoxy-1,4-benzoquinol methylase [Desulfofustis glycolicus DSM 9705]
MTKPTFITPLDDKVLHLNWSFITLRKRLSFEHYENKRLEKIARHCRAGSILDIGYAQHPNPFFSSSHITGVDLRPPLGTTNYDVELTGDATQLVKLIPGRKYDNIIAGEFIEHLENPYAFLRSLKTYLNLGGLLIVSTPNPLSWPCIFFEWFLSERFYYTKEHAYYFPPRWVCRMLESTGYSVSKIQGVGLLTPWFCIPCPIGLSYQVIYIAEVDAIDMASEN